ncbi:MAG TPA: IPT/TIG domain-containing protein [Candidatus Acidoferrales bacterium]|nr:IPT/TIG domain-containing protein [Candidatus Acidoferrales bacterium]
MKTNGIPKIERVQPAAAIPGGEVTIHGAGFATGNHARPEVHFGMAAGSVLLASENMLIARVPEDAEGGAVLVHAGGAESQPYPIAIGALVADNLHPVANPAVDREGNVYVTFSGQRGQKVPVSLYKITPSRTVKPYVTQLVNPTGLTMGRDGALYVSCRNDGTIHRVLPDGTSEQWVEGMGIATGLAFDRAGNLYVGDRSGTIFKIGADRQIFVFATLEPSMSAYHLAFHPSGDLYVTGPTTSSFDRVYRITPAGEVEVFYKGLGRPQGMAFDRAGNLYVAASCAGKRGVVRITPDGQAELALSGNNIVGMVIEPNGHAYVATCNPQPSGALYSLNWSIEGAALPA